MLTPQFDASVATDTPISLTDLGRVRVLRVLAEYTQVSRAEITTRTGLARATVASVIFDLISAGVVRETVAEPITSRAGRPPQILSLEPEAAFALGLDIAHDHVRAILTDVVGKIRWDRTVPMAVDGDPGGTLTAAERLINTALDEVGISRTKILGLGVGIASPVNKDGRRLHAEGIMPGWVGVRPVDELTERTGLSVQIINDANAGVLAERRYGAARACDDVIYLRLSSGIGAGAICDGRMLLGHGGIAGELGHVIVEPDGLLCRCGNRGCLETVASPPAIADLLTRSWGRPVGGTDLVELLRAGDRAAARAVEDAGAAVGRALATTVTLLNPQLIVVGGELAATHNTLFEPMRRTIVRNTMACHAESLRIVPSALGDNAGVRGAAALILEGAPEALALR